jgi:ABC-2 type transport system ATP-binding protein
MNADRWGVAGLVVQRQGRAVLDDIDLDVVPGTVRVVVGGDGAGKTTLLRVLAGTVSADSGSVRRPTADRIGAMIEAPAIYTDLSVDEHVSFVAASYGVSDPVRVQELLRRADLLDARDRLGGQLSGGMRQKLAVILALLHRPALVLLDEPTTGVDPVSRAEVWRLISLAAAEGAAVLLSTTYLDEAERADVAYVLHDGRVLLAGHPQALLAGAQGRFGLTDVPVDGLPCWRRGRGWRVWAPDGTLPEGVSPDVPTLEDLVISAQLARQGVAAR